MSPLDTSALENLALYCLELCDLHIPRKGENDVGNRFRYGFTTWKNSSNFHQHVLWNYKVVFKNAYETYKKTNSLTVY